MSTQTVFRFASRNGLNSLTEHQEPIPTIESNEILVKIRSVGLNGADVAIQTGFYPLPAADNRIPCSDMAGEVVQVGPKARGFAVGDRVTAPLYHSFLYGLLQPEHAADSCGVRTDGMMRQYVAIAAHVAVKLPKFSHDFTQWAALVQSGSTIWNAFYGNKALAPGDTVLLQGTGGISLVALIFAKAAGATTIVTSSSDDKLRLVQSKYGADHGINYKTITHWGAEVQRLTDGHGADHIIENGGSGNMKQSLEAVARGGIISVVGFLDIASQDQMPDVTTGSLTKGCIIRGIQSGSKQQLEEAIRFMHSRGLQMPVERTYAFERKEIMAAFEHVAAGKQIGKICIDVE